MDNNKEYRNATVHRMMRWPNWKDSRQPGTYMVTVKVNGDQKLLGSLAGRTDAVYVWIKVHTEQAQRASADSLYYRHALLGTIAMPFVLKETASQTQGITQAVETAAHKDSGGTSLLGGFSSNRAYGQSLQGGSPSSLSSCDGVSTPSSTTGLHGKTRTHFPLEALRQPTAPHIVLTALWERKSRSVWSACPRQHRRCSSYATPSCPTICTSSSLYVSHCHAPSAA